jgi:hypothetical protein
MLSSEQLRSVARDYITQAHAASVWKHKLLLTGLAKSYLLLSKNAQWIDSTDKFLQAVQSGESWPGPSADDVRHPPSSEGPAV